MLSRVKATNFLSFEDLEFRVDSGITLIDGWNVDDQTSEGSGKSSILNAISWCIYGKLPKDTNIDDVIKHDKDSCQVIVELSDKTRIIRSRKPNKLYTEKDGKVEKGKDARETQKLVEKLIGLSFETFCQTVYFAQNYDKKFITSSQEGKGKILSEVQDLDLFDRARKEIVQLLKLSKEEYSQITFKLESLRKDIEVNTKLQGVELSKSEIVQKQHQNNIDQLTTKIQEDGNSLEQYNLQINNLENTQIDIRDTQELSNALVSLRVSKEQKSSDLNNIESIKRERMQLQKKQETYLKEFNLINTKNQELSNFIENPKKDCPTCGTHLGTHDTTHAKAELVNNSRKMNELKDLVESIHKELQKPEPSNESLLRDISELDQNIAILQSEISKIEKNNQEAIRVATQKESLQKEVLKITKLIEDQYARLLQLQQTEPSFDYSTLKNLRSERVVQEEQNASLTELHQDKQVYIRRLEELKVGFKEVKSYVFNSILIEINSKVNQYLEKLFEVPVSANFTNDNMKIETSIVYDGIPRSLGLLSGGQFRRVSLAVDLALSDVISARKGSKLNVLILDEYFKDLSESSMEKCLNLLKDRSQPVILIEHNSIFKNIIDNTFLVRLEDGTSYVEA